MKTMKNYTNPKNLIKVSLLGLFMALASFLPINTASASDYGNPYSAFSPSDYYDVTPIYSESYGSDYYDVTPIYSESYGSDYYDVTPIYSESYYNYPSYSTPSYGGYDSYSGYSAPSYVYNLAPAYDYAYTPAPTYDYVYNTPTRGATGGASAAQSQYVYSSNENNNANVNDNNNVITNTFNPTNNNDARINLIVYGGGTGTNTSNPTQALDGVCVINPTVAYINQDVTFSASATGGNGGYSYSWTGTDGMYSSAQSFTGRYSNLGYKTVTVTIRSGSETITRSCGVNVQAYNTVLNTQSNVTVIRDQNNLGTPVSGVFLSQVPATGIGFGLKMTLFSVGLILWSLFAAYMISRKKNGAFANKVNAFKLANMQKKGIQA